MYTIEDFLQGNFGINCRTIDEARRLMRELSQKKVKWPDDSQVDYVTYFEEYQEETCYIYKKDFGLQYTGINHCREFLILPYQKIKNTNNKSTDIVKDLLKLLNGGKRQ